MNGRTVLPGLLGVARVGANYLSNSADTRSVTKPRPGKSVSPATCRALGLSPTDPKRYVLTSVSNTAMVPSSGTAFSKRWIVDCVVCDGLRRSLFNIEQG